ncbi:MAG: CbbQ/NirQ/NorQ/GpvN family protein [Methylococcales bacterium]|jgi:nitric oxide reductase NorQ protein|nr:CbbQ/NirQ/NorQ/GpvN family protein [Methylococcales bacterium]MBT7444488.1 CbbQ/NirQ/NorQ/GpvN family protein [Methylococcales bacterium]
MNAKILPPENLTTPYYLPHNNEIDLFNHAFNKQLPVLIKGPTGCGKTRFVEYMAKKLDLPLYTVACHDDLTSSDLVGRHLIQGQNTVWNDGPLTKAVRHGGICYLDEFVEARKDTTVILHPLSDDRRILPLERAGEILKAPKNFMLVVSYNPGYKNVFKALKPSTRQRFLAMRFNYPKAAKEQEIVMKESGIAPFRAQQLVSLANAFRNIKDQDLEEGASTRLLVYTAQLIESGFNPIDACIAGLIEPLTDDEETIDALMSVVQATFG